MTKTAIKFTGRKSLPQSAFNFDWKEGSDGVVCIFELLDKSKVEGFPPESRVRVMLSENKSVHFADFGTLGDLKTSATLDKASLISPSVELRIVNHGSGKEHLLLGSAKLPKSNNSGDAEGILHFQKKDTTPFLWELSVEEDSFPILYLNEKMESKVDPILWVKSNPVFLVSVFPVVIEKVFSKIFESGGKLDEGWMFAWVNWVEKTMGCDKFPSTSNVEDFGTWLEAAKSVILTKMNLFSEALNSLVGEENLK